MQHLLYNPQALKKPTNLSINSDLLRKAKELDINISAAVEQALAETVKQKERDKWLAENKSSIEAYNQQVEDHGVFSDNLRSF
jgi:antitoxin CcdA